MNPSVLLSALLPSWARGLVASGIACIVMSFALSACGGGGSPGTAYIGTSPSALSTSAPSSVTLTPGQTVEYTIQGGKGANGAAVTTYTESSGNTSIVTASSTGSTAFSLTGVAVGTTTVAVEDSAGDSVTINITVSTTGQSAGTLYTTAPSAVTIGVGVSPIYSIYGGVAPYKTSTSDAAIATSSITSSNQLTITGVAGGTANIDVLDAAGTPVTIAVTISTTNNSPVHIAAPAAISLVNASQVTYPIGGGTGAYIVTTSNAAVVTASISGNNLTVVGVGTGSAYIAVFDNNWNTASLTVNVTAGAAPGVLYTTAPSALTTGVGTAPVYSIFGGVAPYQTSTSNAAVATSKITSSNQLTITGVASGTANIEVIDSTGTTVAIAATINTVNNGPVHIAAPASISLVNAAQVTYAIGGGTGTYTVTTSNSAIATATISGNSLTVVGVSAGSANIAVFDSNWNTASLTVNVTASATPGTLYTTAPSALTINLGASSAYSILGGVAPYQTSTSNASIATSRIASSNQLTITGVAGGTANIEVIDSTGTTVTIAVTTNVVSSTVNALYTTAPSTVTVGVNSPVNYNIGGGTGPYTASSSNAAAVSVSVTNSQVTVTGLIAGGTSTVTVFDSTGKAVAFAATVSSGAVPVSLYTTAPSSVTIAASGPAITYTIGGGTGTYTVTSSDVALATVTQSGNSFTVTGVKASATTVTIAIVDTLGAAVDITVTVD